VTIKGVEQLLTPEEVAELLGVSPRHVLRALIKTGALKSAKISPKVYRVRPIDFTDYLDRRKTR